MASGSSPRVRGTRIGFFLSGCATGSSPRVRGTRHACSGDSRGDRFIPARAGNTARRSIRRAATAVHPRACGEHGATKSLARRSPGSSPRVRGTRRGDLAPHVARRFIPARAGNARRLFDVDRRDAVHPRACGEHAECDHLMGDRDGSSPRVRGTLFPFRTLRMPHPVHPRACGEHDAPRARPCCRLGSSPRVRGTRRQPGPAGRHPRFIPARAGNTAALQNGFGPSAVHPRACGEHSERFNASLPHIGSSPRVRGTRAEGLPDLDPPRFIPARAGNTAGTRLLTAQLPVHPRACGEHSSAFTCSFQPPGSSPRVRGTLEVGPPCQSGARFIPARAGNT